MQDSFYFPKIALDKGIVFKERVELDGGLLSWFLGLVDVERLGCKIHRALIFKICEKEVCKFRIDTF